MAPQAPTKSIEELVPTPYHQYLPKFKKSAAQGLPPQLCGAYIGEAVTAGLSSSCS
ncbi:hypothetical protein VP01_8533g1 [Puccinia sorghi]|uniref:Uncharacterized protein n=1 Tax=Puccinia sorghi TaxID=27349 RepID=A0A0L6UB76_9BASI|nr:hypothetical protein VP01_8533g1 [Puccinia sorghi]